MPLVLKWRGATVLPVDGSGLSPESCRDRAPDEVKRRRLPLGNTSVELGELFQVAGTKGDEELVVEGDVRRVHDLGCRMGLGLLRVHGDAGPQLGAGMTGGTIIVTGSVGDWAGAEMGGGKLSIRGDAGAFLGAAYPGSRRGMREGVILVDGSVGDDAGLQMRRGLIAIRGSAGGGVGRSMIAGTIVVLGPAGPRLGAGMKRGTLVLPGLEGPPEEHILPTFAYAGRFPCPFLAIYCRQLAAWGFAVPAQVPLATLDRYNGDLATGGRGEILAGHGLK